MKIIYYIKKREIISEYANYVNDEINKLYDPENNKDVDVLFNVPYLDNKTNTVKTADLLIVLPDGTVDIKLFESINAKEREGEFNINWRTYSNFKSTIESIKEYLNKIGVNMVSKSDCKDIKDVKNLTDMNFLLDLLKTGKKPIEISKELSISRQHLQQLFHL